MQVLFFPEGFFGHTYRTHPPTPPSDAPVGYVDTCQLSLASGEMSAMQSGETPLISPDAQAFRMVLIFIIFLTFDFHFSFISRSHQSEASVSPGGAPRRAPIKKGR